jgi:probable addiction module antidote protein
MALKLNDFDPARYLETEEDVAEYLNSMMEEGNTELLIAALGDVARARGMSEIARASGLTREALYRALKSDAQPRFDTVVRVCNALGLKLNVEVAH